MENNQRYEILKFIINRYDHYYSTVNDKGNAYLALNTFMVGGVIAGYVWLINTSYKTNLGCWSAVLFILFLICNSLSVFFTLVSLNPFIGNQNTKKTNSLFFFADVALFNDNELKEKWKNNTEEELLTDLICQSRELAIGLKKKFHYLAIATYLIGVQLLMSVLFGIIFINII